MRLSEGQSAMSLWLEAARPSWSPVSRLPWTMHDSTTLCLPATYMPLSADPFTSRPTTCQYDPLICRPRGLFPVPYGWEEKSRIGFSLMYAATVFILPSAPLFDASIVIC